MTAPLRVERSRTRASVPADLAAALLDPATHATNRLIFQALTSAVPTAAQLLTGPACALTQWIIRCAPARDREQQLRLRRYLAQDMLHAGVRALCSAPTALSLIAASCSGPLPANERRALTGALRRESLLCGLPLDDVTLHRMTEELVLAFGRAIQLP